MAQKKTRPQLDSKIIGTAMAIGSGAGVALGVAMDNIGAGIAIGVGAGLSIGAAIANNQAKAKNSGDQE